MISGNRTLPQHLAAGLSHAQLPALDGIRAIAAFLVVFYHFGATFISGGLGVLMFFVLSGFLITWLLLKEDDKFGNISLRDFYARRTLRIFPAFYCYWILLIGVTLIAMPNKNILWSQAAAAFFYVNNYYQAIFGDPNTGLSHTWSLGIEEQFYLLWPITFLKFRRDRRRLAKILALGILAVWVYRFALVMVFHVRQSYVYEAFDTRADHLMIGCLLAVALRAEMFPRLWRGLCSQPWAAVLAASLLAASNLAETNLGVWYRDTVAFMLDPLLVAALIPQTIAFSSSPVCSWLNWGWVQYLGRISYSVYLYQQVIVHPAKKLTAGLPVALQALATAAAVTLVASASYWIVEQPFLRLKKRFKRRAEVPVPVSATKAS